ncbi:hypothetical protein KY311_04320 [Candidatus Woesearchaeota archaeon]|nr:hypothetical protein [Candidatus Woesearchaeota archaeon]
MPELTEILNHLDEESSEKIRRCLMHVVEIHQDVVGVYFSILGYEIKYIPRAMIPEHFNKELEPDDCFIVGGNFMTRYAKDLFFSYFDKAPEPDPNDGLAEFDTE